MYALDKPKIIKSAFEITSKSVASENGYQVINISGYASKMMSDSGGMVVDADEEIVNTANIDLKRLKLGRMPLLFQHDQKSIVGNVMKAEYRPEGLFVEAQVVLFPDDPVSYKVFHGVNAGILNSFSIGALVKNFDVATQDGEDYLVLDETELIEISIVSVPSNAESGFRVMNAVAKGVGISKKSLKEQNPDICDDFSCAINKAMEEKDEASKALTLEDTLDSSWMKTREFHMYLDALVETIEDNYYTNKWDELTAEEARANIIDAFSLFLASKVKLNEGAQTSKGQEEMQTEETTVATKSVEETNTQVDNQVETVVPETEATQPTVNDKPGETAQDELEQTVEDAVVAKPEDVVPPEENTEDNTVVAEEVPDDTKVEMTLDSIEEFIGEIDLDSVDVDSLEKLLGLAETINSAVEAKVKEQLKEQLLAAS